MTTRRIKSDAKKEDILAAALPLAEANGYTKVTRDQIGQAAGCGGTVLHYHFGTMAAFRRELMRYAVARGSYAVIAQGLAAGDKYAKKAPEETRRRALQLLMGA